MLKASFAVLGASGCGRGVLPLVHQQLAQRAQADGVLFFEARAAHVVQLDEVAMGTGAVVGNPARVMYWVQPQTPALANMGEWLRAFYADNEPLPADFMADRQDPPPQARDWASRVRHQPR